MTCCDNYRDKRFCAECGKAVEKPMDRATKIAESLLCADIGNTITLWGFGKFRTISFPVGGDGNAPDVSIAIKRRIATAINSEREAAAKEEWERCSRIVHDIYRKGSDENPGQPLFHFSNRVRDAIEDNPKPIPAAPPAAKKTRGEIIVADHIQTRLAKGIAIKRSVGSAWELSLNLVATANVEEEVIRLRETFASWIDTEILRAVRITLRFIGGVGATGHEQDYLDLINSDAPTPNP